MMKQTRATPPITPPTMGPVLLGLAAVDDWGAVVGPEGLPELVVDCFVLGVGVVDCGSEWVVVVVLVVELEVSVTVTDDAAAWVCEIVFATSAGLECQIIPAGLSIPEPRGSAASAA
jgi:hypothetical protein